MARVQVVNQVSEDREIGVGHWVLCLQWCRYLFDDGGMERGYRIIWRRPNGNLQGARGQARIPSLDVAKELIDKAIEDGWGDYEGD